MSIRHTAIGGIVLLLFFGLSPGLLFAQEQQQEPAAESAGMTCGDCHEQAKEFVANPHARGHVEGDAVPRPVCESCHGDGTAHMEAGGDKSLIKVPRGFDGAENTCASCHGKTTERRSHRMGAHANQAAVNCLSCHAIHKPAQPVHLIAKPEPALCASCHGTQAASFRNKPYTHRLGGASMGCTSCHDPHARPGRENVRTTAAGEVVCLNCHGEKRGPYVFNHGGVGATENECANCHDPHGSANPNQLRRATVAQVCMECHSPLTSSTLGSQPPSFHNLRLPRYQNCTTCHVAVHGSNRSPQLLK
jgi:DmsE family decaheme c-type cytochrome